ncbi:MAG: hypothetical protein H7Y30_06980 [Pyrinomonadaceae bacterium]|nr:hypothetical protein [Pyrinomonadaceae bacterium]
MRLLKSLGVILLALCAWSCATAPAPDAAGPRADEPSYPVRLADDGTRREASLAVWVNFTRNQGINDAPAPEFQPVTATLRSIPALTQTPLYLPSVGEGVPMTEEETREALRRFITETGPLLCGERQQLSLVQRIDGADGVKEARYQQRPFRYSLRNGYGEVRILFAPDRRVVQIHSTCIPEIERIRRGFVGLSQQFQPVDKSLENIAGRVVTYTDANGGKQTYTLPEKEKISARELIIFPLERAGDVPVLEFHVAWEVLVSDAPEMRIYLDAVTGEIVGAERIQQT